MIRFFCMFASLAIPVAASASEPAQPATPVGNSGTWVTSDDYPMEAMRQEIEGATSFRLDIDRDGIPTNCTTTSSSGAAILDETACAKAMERARFSPAKDASGSAVSGTFTARRLSSILISQHHGDDVHNQSGRKPVRLPHDDRRKYSARPVKLPANNG